MCVPKKVSWNEKKVVVIRTQRGTQRERERERESWIDFAHAWASLLEKKSPHLLSLEFPSPLQYQNGRHRINIVQCNLMLLSSLFTMPPEIPLLSAYFKIIMMEACWKFQCQKTEDTYLPSTTTREHALINTAKLLIILSFLPKTFWLKWEIKSTKRPTYIKPLNLRKRSHVQNLNCKYCFRWSAAIAQGIRLHLPFWHPRFESQDHNLRFNHYSQICAIFRNENKRKEAGFGQLLTMFEICR